MKIKEKIKKIGNRKYCLLLALLILALLFTVLMPKINLGTQKASALSAPQTKTLDLNGESYSYQTSLQELKNNYGLLRYDYNSAFLSFSEDTEGVNYITLLGANSQLTETERNVILELLNNNIELYNNNEKYSDGYDYDTTSTEYPAYTFNSSIEKDFNLSDLTKIKINFTKLTTSPFVKNTNLYNGGFFVSMYYVNNNLPQNPTNDDIYKNQINLGYAFGFNKDYIFEIEKINGYSLRKILISYAGKTLNTNYNINSIYSIAPSTNVKLIEYSNIYQYSSPIKFCIDDIKFINNYTDIKFDIIAYDYLYNTGDDEGLFKGNLLLSRSKMDANMLEYFNGVNAPITTVVTQSFGSPIFFGATNNTGKRVTNIYYCKKEDGGALPSPYVLGEFYLLFDPPRLSTSFNDIICSSVAGTLSPLYPNNWINFTYQNRLLNVPEAQTLRISSENYDGAGLSAQVEDVLYNVQYLGKTEKIQQEEEIKKDFENMLYVTGAFAVIGLLLGFVFGNPILGLVIGAIVGFGLTIIPIILDGLQAIFGQQFLDGLQNFFRTIASSIANVVSSILNFLFDIITNPAVLVLVLIVAILYLFVFRNKE